MQIGCIRYDLDQRMQKTLKVFRQDMDEHMADTLVTIETPIDKDRLAKSQDEAATASRCESLTSRLATIESAENQLRVIVCGEPRASTSIIFMSQTVMP